MTPTLTKMLSSMKAKPIWGHNARCIPHWNHCSVFKRVNCLRLWNIDWKSLWRKMFPRQPFATNAIYHSVTQPHHVMLLLAIYSCVKDGMTFDQCVWPCFTLLPPHLILNLSYEPFSLCGDKREAHARHTFNVRQIAFCLWAFKLLVLVLRVHVQPYGRRCKVSAGYPESTVLLHGRPAGCGRPARNHLQQELGSSRSAERTRKKLWASK